MAVSESSSMRPAGSGAEGKAVVPPPRVGYPPVFLHVPKAGGSTLIHALEWSFGKHSVWRRRDPGWPMDLPAGEELPASHVKAYAGHMTYGLHARLGVPVTYLSLVRDPVSRLCSAYHYIRRVERNPLHDAVVGTSLSEFARNPFREPEFDNGQLRRLHPDGASIPLGGCTTDHVWDVLDLIAQGDLVVGTCEQMTRSLALFWRRLPDVGVPSFLSQNVMGDSRTRADWEDRKALAEHNQFDVILHQIVSSLVLEEAGTDRAIAATVNRIEWRNRYVHPLRTLPSRIRAKSRYEWNRRRRGRTDPRAT